MLEKIRLFFLHSFAFGYRNYIFAKRNVFFVIEILFWPVMTLLTIGLMGGFLKLEENALSFVLTGAIASGVLQVTQLDVGYSILYDVWSKSIKHTFLTPVGLTPSLLGSWMTGILRGTFVLAILLYLSRRFFDFTVPGFLPFLQFLLGIYWMALLAGICVWILVLLYGQRAEIAVWAISHVVMLFCGIYYPVNLLPKPFYEMAQWVPLTYFMDDYRSHYGFPILFEQGLLKGWSLNVGYLVALIFAARLALGRARRNGLLLSLSE